jgi:hypothetical protein
MQKPYSDTIDYKRLMDHIVKLPSCTLVTTGRTGTDFLQSLLDSHTQILTFNGSLFFHVFWEGSYCAKTPNIDVGDLLDEFIGKHIEKLKSRYDLMERKDMLGENADETIDIDLVFFKKAAKALLLGRVVNSKNVLLAIYGAYSLCLDEDIEKKGVFFHHIHTAEMLGSYLNDFPDSKIICMTRDPRANFVSGIQHWRKYNPLTDNGKHLLYYVGRILKDAYVLDEFDNDYVVMRIEDLGKKQVLEKLCEWLGILYEDQLIRSTWGGMIWRGDRLSPNKNEVGGWSAKMLENSWEKKLSLTDKYLFNFLMNSRLKFYGYQHQDISFFDYFAIPILILFPLSFELRYFSPSYFLTAFRNKSFKMIALNCYGYLVRIALFYKYYAKAFDRHKFSRKFIDGSEFEVPEAP